VMFLRPRAIVLGRVEIIRGKAGVSPVAFPPAQSGWVPTCRAQPAPIRGSRRMPVVQIVPGCRPGCRVTRRFRIVPARLQPAWPWQASLDCPQVLRRPEFALAVETVLGSSVKLVPGQCRGPGSMAWFISAIARPSRERSGPGRANQVPDSGCRKRPCAPWRRRPGLLVIVDTNPALQVSGIESSGCRSTSD